MENSKLIAALIVAAILVAVGLIIWLFTTIENRKAQKAKDQIETANQEWLRKKNLPNRSNRSIIEILFGVRSWYVIGIPKVDWEDRDITLSVQVGRTIVGIKVDLNTVNWIINPYADKPNAHFIYDESLLQNDFSCGYYSDGDLEAAMKNVTIEKIFKMASNIEVSVTQAQYDAVFESLTNPNHA